MLWLARCMEVWQIAGFKLLLDSPLSFFTSLLLLAFTKCNTKNVFEERLSENVCHYPQLDGLSSWNYKDTDSHIILGERSGRQWDAASRCANVPSKTTETLKGMPRGRELVGNGYILYVTVKHFGIFVLIMIHLFILKLFYYKLFIPSQEHMDIHHRKIKHNIHEIPLKC